MTPSPEEAAKIAAYDHIMAEWRKAEAECDRLRAALEEVEASFPDAREMGRVARRALREDPTDTLHERREENGMKRTIVTIVASMLIGGATLGPLAANAAENATLRQRVAVLEERLDSACDTAKVYRPLYYRFLAGRGAC